jgi:hypothetical protein
MTTMTESQLEDHIASKEWRMVNTKRRGSQDYDSHIGVLRVMFGITDDPEAVTTLLDHKTTEVWIKNDNSYERLFNNVRD